MTIRCVTIPFGPASWKRSAPPRHAAAPRSLPIVERLSLPVPERSWHPRSTARCGDFGVRFSIERESLRSAGQHVRYGNLPFSAAFNIWHAAPRFCYHCVTTESAVSGSDRNGPIKALRDSTPDASPTMLSGGSWPLSRPLSHSTDLARRSARTHRGPVLTWAGPSARQPSPRWLRT
jgi:hypothetical protein